MVSIKISQTHVGFSKNYEHFDLLRKEGSVMIVSWNKVFLKK